jgi:tetratricopeptide (TPR) repeat protein
VAKKYSDDGTTCYAAWIIAWAHISRGALDQALEMGEMAVEKAPTPADKAWAQCVLAWAWSRGGEPHKAVELLAQIVSMSREARFFGGEIFTAPLVEGYWLAAEYEQATRATEEMLDIATRSGMRFHVAFAHRLLGEIALSTGSSRGGDAAASHFETSIGILREIKAQNDLALAYAGYGRLHKQQGRIAEARDYLTRALEIFERLGTLREPDHVREDLAQLPAP